MESFRYLFSPLKIGKVVVKNRIYNPPHATIFADENFLPTEKQVYYYAERAKGGAGMIVIGGSVVHRNSLAHIGFNLVSDERSIPRYQKIAEAVHAHGAIILSQLSHHGRQTTNTYSRLPSISPSPIPCMLYRETPKEMEKEDMEEVLQGFVRGAKNVQQAGFDGVEIYAAHGYLLSQFLSPHTNKRKDEYGGTLENRMRFPLEVVQAVREGVGKDFVVGVRVNGDDFTAGGLVLRDAQVIARKFADTKLVDFISVTGTTYNAIPLLVADMSFPLGVFVHLAAGIKEKVDLPVVCVNRINDPLQAEKILEDGQADMIGMGRALICDPELPNKAKMGRLNDIRYCIACNQGCMGREIRNAPIGCTYNAAVGEEKELGIGTLKPATRRKKVMVVGGGPGGMEAARVAAERGHEVTLYEQNRELGGQINLLTRVESRKEFQNVVKFLTGQLEKLGVRVNLGVEVSPETVLSAKPDSVVVATGSVPLVSGFTPFRPDVEKLPGVDQENVLTVWEVLLGTKEVGKRVLLIDEEFDFRSTSTAEFLALQGKQVEIVTRLPYVGMEINFTSLGPQLQRLRKNGVLLTPLIGVKEIQGNTVVLFDIFTQEERKLEGIDTVVLSMINKANSDLHRQLKGKVKELYAVGDCVAPRRVIDAVYEGHRVARLL